MQYLIDQARVFRARAATHGMGLGRLADGQRPRAMLISCSDARIVPAQLTGCEPGDLFELRTYGGTLPGFNSQFPTGESRTIEYAVDELKISDIIVLGHSHCDVVSAAIHIGDAPSADSATQPHEAPAPLTGDLAAAGQWHTLSQLDILSGYPCVAHRLADQSLRLHAWFYEVDTGATLHHHPRANAFLPL